MKKKILPYLCLLLAMALLVQCRKKKEDEEPTPESSFDKAGMLANYGDNIIVPAYAGFAAAIDSLKVSSDLFVAAPGQVTLDELQAELFNAYSEYQWISTFEFGPAESELVRGNFNIFPCDSLEINNKIAAGNTDFSTVADIDAKGLPALDFLLHGKLNDDNIILSLFTTDANAANRKNYVVALVNDLKTKTTTVKTAWSASGGNYLSVFKSSTGTDVGSSIGLLVNQLNQDLELLKNARMGIPLGKFSLGVLHPEKTEGYYSGRSLELASEHLKNIENVYLGRNRSNSNGSGLDDYLSHLGAMYGSGSLNDAIKNKFSLAKTKLSAIPSPLADAVVNNTAVVDAAYVELQQLVILLKVDMTSAMGVSITYVDNDGD